MASVCGIRPGEDHVLQPASTTAPASGSGGTALPEPSALGTSSAPPVDEPREIVIRPSGLRKGVWEASNTYFYVAAGLLGVVVVVWLLFRFGVLKLPKRAPKEEAPKSSRTPPAKGA